MWAESIGAGRAEACEKFTDLRWDWFGGSKVVGERGRSLHSPSGVRGFPLKYQADTS